VLLFISYNLQQLRFREQTEVYSSTLTPQI
jgi:hypothetical protein